MELSRTDVEMLAKGRVSKAEAKRTNQWIIGAGILLVISLFVVRLSPYAGYAIMAFAVLGVLYYMNQLSKKQNAYKSQLVQQWESENKGK